MCVLTNKRSKTYQTICSFCRWVMPQGQNFGVLVGQNFKFSEHGHVKLKEMMSRTECKKIHVNYPKAKLTLGWGQKSLKISTVKNFSVGDICDGTPLTAHSSFFVNTVDQDQLAFGKAI